MKQKSRIKEVARQEELLSSNDVAQQLGVAVASIKRWADAGLLECIKTAGGHRRFTQEAVERFQQPQPNDSEPASSHNPERWLELLLSQHEPHAITGMLLQERAKLGAWWRVADSLGAALALMGRQWSAGQFAILDEHLISERLARGLARCAEAIPLPSNALRALLASAEGDEHTLGLSLAELCLREAGLLTIWSGRRTPTSEMIKSLQQKQIHYITLSASAFSDEAVLARQALKLSEACAQTSGTLLLGGTGSWPEQLPHTFRIKSFQALHAALPHLL